MRRVFLAVNLGGLGRQEDWVLDSYTWSVFMVATTFSFGLLPFATPTVSPFNMKYPCRISYHNLK